jgi:predicted 3-demethylubiquinone-9 3-methyltransferase (glyoxalase superfamily)
MRNIAPCLWFDNQAEEAANFYVSVFKNSRVTAISHYGDGMPLPKGMVLEVSFELNGEDFLALNGGPIFTFSPAISFVVNCETQEEIDDLWTKLRRPGERAMQVAQRQVRRFLADRPGDSAASHG